MVAGKGVALLALLMCLGGAVYLRATPSPSRAQLPRKAAPPLRIACDLWAGYYPVVLADELGFFTRRGVKVTASFPQNTDQVLASLTAHNVDAAAVSFADLMTVAAAQPDIRLVLVTDESAGADQVLGRREFSPGSLSSSKLRVGTNLGGFGEVFIRSYFEDHHLPVGGIEWVDVEAAEAPARLQAGDLDAVHTWEPYATRARAEGAHLWFSSAETEGAILDGVVFRGDILKTRAAEVHAFVAAWFEAAAYWQAHRDEGAQIIARRLHIQPGDAKPEGVRLFGLSENQAAFGLHGNLGDAPVVRTLERYIAFFTRQGALSRALNASALVDPSFLP